MLPSAAAGPNPDASCYVVLLSRIHFCMISRTYKNIKKTRKFNRSHKINIKLYPNYNQICVNQFCSRKTTSALSKMAQNKKTECQTTTRQNALYRHYQKIHGITLEFLYLELPDHHMFRFQTSSSAHAQV